MRIIYVLLKNRSVRQKRFTKPGYQHWKLFHRT